MMMTIVFIGHHSAFCYVEQQTYYFYNERKKCLYVFIPKNL